MDIEAFGIAVSVVTFVTGSAIALWPRRDIQALKQLEADEMTATRELLQSAAIGCADDEQMPDSMTPALLDYADSLVPSVHAGTMTPASAIDKITKRARHFAKNVP